MVKVKLQIECFQKNVRLHRLLSQSHLYFVWNWRFPSILISIKECDWYIAINENKGTPSICGILTVCPKSNSHHSQLILHLGLNFVPLSNWLIISILSIPTPFIWYHSTHGSLSSKSTRLWIDSWLLNKLCQAIKPCVTGLGRSLFP